MPFNGSGTYTLPYNWNNDAANSINITASRMQAQDQDQATALSDCVTRDGQSAWTANLPAGGFKITGLGNGSASTDSAALGQVFQISNNLSEGTAATMRTNLGLGTSATVNTGTSGATIPLLNGTNTWANAQTFSAAATFSSTINKYTLTAPATGATLTIADGKTHVVSNSITLAGTDSTTMTFPGASCNVGYLEIPDSSGSGVNSYTAVLGDSGKMIRINGASKTATIPANASVAYPVGTTLTFINTNASSLSIAITSDTMTLANSTSTGTRTLAQNGIATAVKMTSTTWLISGTGLS